LIFKLKGFEQAEWFLGDKSLNYYKAKFSTHASD
jgi:hypothetical protein